MKQRRAYTQTLRAQKTQENEARILDVAEALFSTELFDRVTLDAVARAAAVTIPTLQRRYGNKDGLFVACGERLRARVEAQRGAPPAELRVAIRQLVDHYELEGARVWNLLRQEQDVPYLKSALDEARAVHRAWVTAVCGASARAALDALVAATDLFVWKLLRIDLGRSRVEVEETMFAMVHAIAGRK